MRTIYLFAYFIFLLITAVVIYYMFPFLVIYGIGGLLFYAMTSNYPPGYPVFYAWWDFNKMLKSKL